MRYLILCLAFITVLFTANTLMDKYFAKEKERRDIIELVKTAPNFYHCRFCGYVGNGLPAIRCPNCSQEMGE